MKKRVLSVILAMIITVPLILGFSASAAESLSSKEKLADVDNDGVVSVRDAAIIARYFAHWTGYRTSSGGISYPEKAEYIKSYSPDTAVDFGGREFRFLVMDPSSSEHLMCHEVLGVPTGSVSRFQYENDTVVARNKYLEDKYNCKIVQETVPYSSDKIRNDYLAGNADYDFIYSKLSSYKLLVALGAFIDFGSVSTVNLDADYFNQSLNDQMSLSGTYFYLMGAATTSPMRTLYTLLADYNNIYNYGGSNGEKVDIYNLVSTGKWTLDKFYEISTNEYNSSNANIKHTLIAEKSAGISSFSVGADADMLKRDSNGNLKYVEDFVNSSEATKIYGKIKDILSHEGRFIGERGASQEGYNAPYSFLMTNMASFSNSYNSLGRDFIMLPMPKADINQANYKCALSDFACAFSATRLWMNDTDAKYYGFENGIDMAGFFMSAFFDASKNHTGKSYSVEESLREHLVSQSAFKNHKTENTAMWNTIRNTMTVYYGTVFNYGKIGSLVYTYCTNAEGSGSGYVDGKLTAVDYAENYSSAETLQGIIDNTRLLLGDGTKPTLDQHLLDNEQRSLKNFNNFYGS